MNPIKKLVQESVKGEKRVVASIPWQDKNKWEQVFESIKRVDARQCKKLNPVRDMAKTIHSLYEQLSGVIEGICSQTCISCKDICCVRATLWFDLKDLLYIYFATNAFPEAQIFKKGEGGRTFCCFFTPLGCSLSRTRRPFVCTWYFCPEQTRYLSLLDKTRQDKKIQETIDGQIKEIKRLRNKMEEEFIRVASN